MRSTREQRHASIIFKGGTPTCFGWNDGNNHAEEIAIIRFNVGFNAPKLKGSTMINIRLTRTGRIALSKPCPACLDLLKEKKFRKVIYSTNEGTFKEIYL